MSRIGDMLRKGVDAIDEKLDRLPHNQRREQPREGESVIVQGYRSYGTTSRLCVEGRALIDRQIPAAEGPGRPLENLKGVYQRFNTREIPAARIVAQWQGRSVEIVADSEGYIEGYIDAPEGITPGWHAVTLSMPDRGDEVAGTSHVMVPDPGAEFGIISDLDDTVIATDVTRRLTMIRNVLLHNAHSRLPWEGADIFYRSLHLGSDGRRMNPIFYVSGGPWNLYDVYHDFLELKGLPAGPIQLADFGVTSEVLIHPKHEDHKAARIAEILETYPELPFVLIGDSGEKDAPIYVKAAETHPGRVRMIYIRDVTPLRDHDELEQLAGRARELGTDMRLVKSTLEAWQDARQRGLLSDPIASG